MAADLLRKTSRKAIHVLRPCRAHTLHTLTCRSMSRGGRVPYGAAKSKVTPVSTWLDLMCYAGLWQDLFRYVQYHVDAAVPASHNCYPIAGHAQGENYSLSFSFFSPTELTSLYLLSPGHCVTWKVEAESWPSLICHFFKDCFVNQNDIWPDFTCHNVK